MKNTLSFSQCVWMHPQEKIISFHEMPGWVCFRYASKEEMTGEMERFISESFRFQ